MAEQTMAPNRDLLERGNTVSLGKVSL